MLHLIEQTLASEPPQRTAGYHAYFHWRWLGAGIIEFMPRKLATSQVVLSAGIHGNETAPVELLDALVHDLFQATEPLSVRLLLIVGNPAALRAGIRYEHTDLNRLFALPAKTPYRKVPEYARAQELESRVQTFFEQAPQLPRYHLDLHTAIRGSRHVRFGLLPWQSGPYDAGFVERLAHAGLDALVLHDQPGHTFSAWSNQQCHACSCTLELGKALPFGKNDLREFSAIRQMMTSLLTGRTPLSPPPEHLPSCYRVTQALTKLSGKFQLHLSDSVLNFTAFPAGTLVAEDGDTRYEVVSPEEFILFPNPRVAVGQRAGLLLQPVTWADIPRSDMIQTG